MTLTVGKFGETPLHFDQSVWSTIDTSSTYEVVEALIARGTSRRHNQRCDAIGTTVREKRESSINDIVDSA